VKDEAEWKEMALPPVRRAREILPALHISLFLLPSKQGYARNGTLLKRGVILERGHYSLICASYSAYVRDGKDNSGPNYAPYLHFIIPLDLTYVSE
jgi:hypothetical protein